MNSFSQVAVQVREVYRRLTFSQKAAFLLLMVVVAGGLAVLTNWGAREDYVRVTSESLGEGRTEILAALDAARIAHRERGGLLEVNSSDYNEATAILATHGVVPSDQIKIRLADIAGEDKLFRTSEDKRAQRLVVLQNWLADVVSRMENIRAASVVIDAPDGASFPGLAEERGSAAVQVWLKPGVDRLSGDQVNGIAALVAGARRTIGKSDVSIIDSSGHEYPVPGGEDAPGIVGDRHEQQLTYERRLAREVREMLSIYNPVKVMVRLKIDFDRVTEQVEDVDPEKHVDYETVRETSERESRDVRSTKRKVYTKVTHLVKAPGDVLDMSVSVFVPREQVVAQIVGRGVEVDEKAADAAIAGELDVIRKSVANMLLVSDLSRITVEAVTFPKPAVAGEPSEAGFAAARRSDWAGHGRTIVLSALTLLALLLLWRMVRKPVEVVVGRSDMLSDEEILAGVEAPGVGGLRGEDVQRKVEQMVRADPQDAANLITRWVRSEG
jgi:flagellar biosynthesis/type III secretory pathway M-ring protein FliF/YscJ